MKKSFNKTEQVRLFLYFAFTILKNNTNTVPLPYDRVRPRQPLRLHKVLHQDVERLEVGGLRRDDLEAGLVKLLLREADRTCNIQLWLWQLKVRMTLRVYDQPVCRL